MAWGPEDQEKNDKINTKPIQLPISQPLARMLPQCHQQPDPACGNLMPPVATDAEDLDVEPAALSAQARLRHNSSGKVY